MKSAYQILRHPVITEKGLTIKENENTLVFTDRKSTRLNSSHSGESRMPSSA